MIGHTEDAVRTWIWSQGCNIGDVTTYANRLEVEIGAGLYLVERSLWDDVDLAIRGRE